MYGTPVDFSDVVHAADVRVRDLPRRPDFVVKLREPDRLVTQPVGQKLERDWLAESEIVSAIDLTHAAFAEQSDNPISAVEQRAWRESAVADRVRRGQPSAVGFRSGRGRRRGAAADDANRAARRQPRWLHADAKGQRLILQCGATRGTEAGAVGKRRSAARARHDGDSTRLRAVRFGGPVRHSGL